MTSRELQNALSEYFNPYGYAIEVTDYTYYFTRPGVANPDTKQIKVTYTRSNDYSYPCIFYVNAASNEDNNARFVRKCIEHIKAYLTTSDNRLFKDTTDKGNKLTGVMF